MSTWIFFAFSVGLQIAGDPVVEAHAERDEQVGLLNRGIDPGFAVHAHHAEFSGCDAGHPPMPSSVIAMGMFDFSANARSAASAPPRMMPWPAKISGRSAALINAPDRRPSVPGGQRRQIRGGGVPVELRVAELRVLRDVDQHRARTAAGRHRKCLANGRRHVARASRGSCAS
jgi:hypothetical protein